MKRRRVLIHERLHRYFSAFSLIPLVIFCAILTAYLASSAWNDSRTDLTGSLRYATEQLDRLFEEAYQIGKSVSEDEEVLKALNEKHDSDAERYLSEMKLDKELAYVSRYFDRNIELYIASENGALYKSGRLSFLLDDYSQEDWYKSIAQTDSVTWLPLSEKSRVAANARGQYAGVGVPIRSRGDARFLGVVLVEVQIGGILSGVNDGEGYFYILEPNLDMRIIDGRVEQYENDVVTIVENGRVSVMTRSDPKPDFIQATMNQITYWRRDFIPEGFKSAGGYAMGYATVNANSWILVGCKPYLTLYRVPLIIVGALIAGVIALSIIAVWAANRAAGTVTRPIMRLNESVHMVSADNFDVVIEKTSDDEIGDLSDQFNQMIRHIKELMTRIIQEQTARRKYELLLLQAQINPHFLYNTLDSIVWLVRMNRGDDATIMLTALTTFFKTGLNKGLDTISLAQEVENARSYMTIQTYRYKTRLTYTASVDDRVAQTEVPKLIIQPLIENAIYHGIKEKQGSGHIKLLCDEWEGGVRIVVEDDGNGMDEGQLERLLSQLDQRDVSSRDSYGVINVYERLRLFFKEECAMNIESEAGVGTRVTIIIGRKGAGHVPIGNRG